MELLLLKTDAVLFDLDGTLVITNIDFALMKRKMIDYATAKGLGSETLAERDILQIVEDTVTYLKSQGKLEEARSAYDDMMALLRDIELEHARDTKEVPGACDTVERLRKGGVKIGIVTRNCREAANISLSMVGIRPDTMICREDTRTHKPDPMPAVMALGALGAKAETSVMVGDHLMDIQSGKAAKMMTIGFLGDDRADDYFNSAGPTFTARDMSGVLDAIVGINS